MQRSNLLLTPRSGAPDPGLRPEAVFALNRHAAGRPDRRELLQGVAVYLARLEAATAVSAAHVDAAARIAEGNELESEHAAFVPDPLLADPMPAPPRAEPPRPNPPRPAPPRAEPPRAEPPRAEPPRAEPPRAEPLRADTPRPGPLIADPLMADQPARTPRANRPVDRSAPTSSRTIRSAPDYDTNDIMAPLLRPVPGSRPRGVRPRQADPRQSDPRQADPRQSDPRQADPRQADPRQADRRQSGRRSDPPARDRSWPVPALVAAALVTACGIAVASGWLPPEPRGASLVRSAPVVAPAPPAALPAATRPLPTQPAPLQPMPARPESVQPESVQPPGDAAADPVLPAAVGLHVVITYQRGDAAVQRRGAALAHTLRSRGYDVADPAPDPGWTPPRQPEIGYFFVEDQDATGSLARQVDDVLGTEPSHSRLLQARGPQPRPGTVWIGLPGAAAAPHHA